MEKKIIIGQKRAMTRRYRDDGVVQPVTVIAAGPCVVTQIRPSSRAGAPALVEIGYGKAARPNKPQQKAHGSLGGPFRFCRTFRVPTTEGYERGTKIDASVFQIGDRVKVSGVSKGRGFAGVVKRHHFRGSPATHGHKDQLRMPGSIGSTAPQRVFKGTRMAGQLGNTRATLRSEVIAVDAQANELLLKGAVPGARNALLTIESQ